MTPVRKLVCHGCDAVMSESLELGDIQGILIRGYASLKHATYLLMHVDQPDVARRTLRRWLGSVTTGEQSPGTFAINIALTAAGIRALRSPAGLPFGFSEQFTSGMATPTRSRMLGDVDEDDPSRWSWGGPTTEPVHLILLLFAVDQHTLEAGVNDVIATTPNGMHLVGRLPADRLSGREVFGFRDGISQPIIAGTPRASESRDVVQPGEFVLGYRNEYGQRTERPLLPTDHDPDRLLPRDADGSGAADLGRNGSYLVFRQLEQDVEVFWDWVDNESRSADGRADPARRAMLAARVVGRWPSGASLALSPDHDDPTLADVNDFGYHHEDPLGVFCPIGSHVRRTNPRNALEPAPGTDRSLRINHRHRILRRGRNYTTPTEPTEEANASAPQHRGVHFVCLNANLARQYEFVQHSWVNDAAFNGLVDSTDPLVGIRHGRGATFTVQGQPLRERHFNLPQFIHVRGGAYFFLPGLRAMGFLTSPPAGG
jgi:Dyp-type peroxidase family